MCSPRPHVWGLVVVVGVLFLSCPAVRAQSRLAGTYRCQSIRAAKHNVPCNSPPLVLYADGSYQIWKEKGTYTVLGNYLVFSEAKKRGPGRLRHGREIVFEYYYQGKRYTVTFRRRATVPAGSAII